MSLIETDELARLIERGDKRLRVVDMRGRVVVRTEPDGVQAADYLETSGLYRTGKYAECAESAEKAMRLTLPGDVKASYRIHDGQGLDPHWGDAGLVGGEGWRLLPVHEIVEQWEHWSRARPKA